MSYTHRNSAGQPGTNRTTQVEIPNGFRLSFPVQVIRVLTLTNRGNKIWEQVLVAASRQIQKGLSFDKGLSREEEDRQLTQATESFETGNEILFGPMQLSFLDTQPNEMNG